MSKGDRGEGRVCQAGHDPAKNELILVRGYKSVRKNTEDSGTEKRRGGSSHTPECIYKGSSPRVSMLDPKGGVSLW